MHRFFSTFSMLIITYCRKRRENLEWLLLQFVVGLAFQYHGLTGLHVAWLAEWHNYAEYNICGMTQRNILN